MTFREQLAYRAKAIIAAFGFAVVGLIGWLVENPATGAALEQVIPVPWSKLVPVVLAGIAATWVVHRVPNRAPAGPAGTEAEAPVTELPASPATTAVRTIDVEH